MAPTTDFSGKVLFQAPPTGKYDASTLAGKSVIITGATTGLGEAFMRAYVQHDAFVTFAARSVEKGEALVKELGADKVAFVRTDVLKWADQVNLFKTALQKSPSKTIDIVIANAGVAGHDVMADDKLTEDGDPAEPNLAILHVDLLGAVYTAKLALHYLARQPEGRDRCLILTSSIAGYLEKPGSPQYNAAKFGVRGLFRSLRTTMPKDNMRVNLVAPWFIPAAINPPEMYKHLLDVGVGLADAKDAAAAVMQLSADTALNGRAVCIIPRSWGGPGYVDLQQDDHPPEDPMSRWQDLIWKMEPSSKVAT